MTKNTDTIHIDKQGIKIVHIAAVSDNLCIGKGNDLPWHISADLKRFKRMTQGGVMVLGRKCYDSFGGRPLPKRSHWVITRQPDWQSGFDNHADKNNNNGNNSNNHDLTRVHVVHSINEALTNAIAEAKEKLLDTVWVIGGGMIYEATLPIADRLEITHVQTHIAGDVFYPSIPKRFKKYIHETHVDEKSGLTYAFVSYVI